MILLVVTAAVGVLALALNLLAPSYLPRAILWGPNTGRNIDPAGDPSTEELHRLGVSGQRRIAVGPPPASLQIWWIDPAGAPRGTVFLLHGIQDQKRSMLGFARKFVAQGYRAVLVDSRAHGRSSGRWLSFGVFESADLVQVLDALEQDGLATGGIGAFGVSYGGATAIQWAGRDPRVRAVVTVATFSSMRAIVPRYIRLYLPGLGLLIPDARIQHCVDLAGAMAGFDPDRASPVEAISRSRARFLLFHGENDWKIPLSHAEALNRAGWDHSGLFLIPHETHDSIMADRSGRIARESRAWFDRFLTGDRAGSTDGDSPVPASRSGTAHP